MLKVMHSCRNGRESQYGLAVDALLPLFIPFLLAMPIRLKARWEPLPCLSRVAVMC